MISGTTVGPILAPGIVFWLAESFSWQISFIVTGAIGLLWLVLWLYLYDKPERSKRLGEAELSYIQSESDQDAAGKKEASWLLLLRKKATWGFLSATLLTDPVWWFYLFWLPSFLASSGMDKTQIAFPHHRSLCDHRRAFNCRRMVVFIFHSYWMEPQCKPQDHNVNLRHDGVAGNGYSVQQ
jgi:MFS family permease